MQLASGSPLLSNFHERVVGFQLNPLRMFVMKRKIGGLAGSPNILHNLTVRFREMRNTCYLEILNQYELGTLQQSYIPRSIWLIAGTIPIRLILIRVNSWLICPGCINVT